MPAETGEIEDTTLDGLVQKLQTAGSASLTSTDVALLLKAFSFPDPSLVRSKAYVLLSTLCQHIRTQDPSPTGDKGAGILTRLLGPPIVDYLSETNDPSLRIGICALQALFQVYWVVAVAILSQSGVLESILEGIDLSQSTELYEDAARLLGQASSHKLSREIIPTQAVQWLETKSQQSTHSSLRAAAAVALIKYSRGATDATSDNLVQEMYMAEMMKELLVSGKEPVVVSDAVEGLAYLSTRPQVKEVLSSDPIFLRRLCSLIPPRSSSATSKESSAISSSLVYGVLLVASNICAYRPRLTEEQAHIEQLKKMAQGGKESEPTRSSELESDEHVRVRIYRLVEAGVLDVTGSALTVNDSLAVRLQLGKTLFNIVQEKENRGKVLQSGGAKTLGNLIKMALATIPSKDQTLDAAYLEIIQALAKLAITSSPIQVFGPDVGAVFDAIRPFSIMLQHPASTLLQKFEAIMALTNLSSYQPEVAERITKADGLLSRVDLLMLEDHVLVRRSAVELICNLVAGSDEVFGRYGGMPDSPASKSKLQILVALADVDDLPTALAASGALATLTCSPHACRALAEIQEERDRVLRILTQLIDPTVVAFSSGDDASDDRTVHESPGLVHRAVVCVLNIFSKIDDVGLRKSLEGAAESAGLVKALVRLTRGEGLTKDQAVLAPAGGALEVMVNDGVRLRVTRRHARKEPM